MPWGPRTACRTGAAPLPATPSAELLSSVPAAPLTAYPYLAARCCAYPRAWKAAAHLVRPGTRDASNTHIRTAKPAPAVPAAILT